MISTRGNKTVSKDILIAITEVNTDAMPWPVAIGEDANQAEYRVDLRIQPAGGTYTLPKTGESWWISIVAGHWALSRRMLRATELTGLVPGDPVPEISTGLYDDLDVRYGALIDEVSDTVDELAAAPGWDPGDIKATARASAPTGWLMCYGQSYDPSVYPDLFAAISNTHGGSLSVPLLPDYRGRTLIGLDNMGGSSANRITAAAADSMGGVGGAESVALAATEMPVHTHTQTAHTHTQSGHSHTVDSHTHSIPQHGHTASGSGTTSNPGDHKHNSTFRGATTNAGSGGGGVWQNDNGSSATSDAGGHTHTLSLSITVNDAASATSGGPSASGTSNVTPSALGDATPAIQNAGGSGGVTQAHANTQPWSAVNYLIKT